MPFISKDLVVKELNADTWQLTESLVYQGEHQAFTVPAGFKTDFASVPKALSWLVPRYGLYTKAAILHDFLTGSALVTQSDADGIFRRSMRELGVPFLRRWIMWAAVRSNGNLKDTKLSEFFLWLAVIVPTAVFLLIPALIVTIWLTIFWLLEYLVLGVQKLCGRKHLTKPYFMAPLDQGRR